MSTVWVVEISDGYDFQCIEAIFATRNEAENWVAARTFGGQASITSWELGMPERDWMGFPY